MPSALLSREQELPFLCEVLCWGSLFSLTVHLLQKYHSESKGTDQVAETQAQVDELKGIMVRNIGIWLVLVPCMQYSTRPEWQSCRESYWERSWWWAVLSWQNWRWLKGLGSSEFAVHYSCWTWWEHSLVGTCTACTEVQCALGFVPVTAAFLQLLWGKCFSAFCPVGLWLGTNLTT